MYMTMYTSECENAFRFNVNANHASRKSVGAFHITTCGVRLIAWALSLSTDNFPPIPANGKLLT